MKVRVPGGPVAEKGGIFQVDAYDVVNAQIPAKAGGTSGTATVKVLPSDTEGVNLLFIYSDNYANLKFATVEDAETSIIMDAPLFLTGSGIVDLLGGVPEKFYFTNE